MTLDEKIGQMVQADLGAVTNPADVQTYAFGSMLSGGNSKPPENNPATWLQTVHELDSWALKTRLKIPLLYGIDAVHGHNDVVGTVIFPHNIGLGATRDPALVEKAEHITALEMAGTGIRWSFAPCLAVAQNERWGRTYESFGQSPELVSEMARRRSGDFKARNFRDGTIPYLPVRSISSGTAGRRMGWMRGTRCVTKRPCANCICRRIVPRSGAESVPSWFPTAVGTVTKCTGTSIC